MSLKDKFLTIIGENSIISEPNDIQPFLHERRNLFHGSADLVIQPKNLEQVSKVVALANFENIAIVPQGGNTGLVGGQQPNVDSPVVILSLAKLNKVRDINLIDQIATVEAGVVLEDLQQKLAEVNCFFPVNIASQGSAQIGGC